MKNSYIFINAYFIVILYYARVKKMQQEIKGNINLGGTVNPSKSTRVVKSVDQTSNFNNADKKRSKLKALIERGKFDKNVTIISAKVICTHAINQ